MRSRLGRDPFSHFVVVSRSRRRAAVALIILEGGLNLASTPRLASLQLCILVSGLPHAAAACGM
jgi:hypothetical protein